MELIAQRGLPVAPAVEQAPLMTGDQKPVIAVPLTNGFARTGYEQDEAAAVAGSGNGRAQVEGERRRDRVTQRSKDMASRYESGRQ